MNADILDYNKKLILMAAMDAQCCQQAKVFELHILNKGVSWYINFIFVIKLIFIKIIVKYIYVYM